MKWIWLVVAALAVVAVAVFDVPVRYILAPLLGLLILRIGLATFGSLRAGGSHIPDGPPEPVDTRIERVTYWCAGCGAELLLLVRGADVAPRHCGERMTVRREVPRGALN